MRVAAARVLSNLLSHLLLQVCTHAGTDVACTNVATDLHAHTSTDVVSNTRADICAFNWNRCTPDSVPVVATERWCI
jgi:hypothetical protein